MGLWLGGTLLPIILEVLLTPVSFFAGVAGGMDVLTLAWIYVLLGFGSVAISLLGVAWSSMMGRRRGALIVVGVYLLLGMWFFWGTVEFDGTLAGAPLMVLSPFAILIASFSEGTPLYHLLNYSVPWQIAPLAYFVFVMVVSFLTARQRFRYPEPRPSGRSGVFVGFLVFCAMLVIFFSDFWREAEGRDYRGVGLGYLSCAFVIIAVWAMLTIPDYEMMLQSIGRRNSGFIRMFTRPLNAGVPAFAMMTLQWIMAAGVLLVVYLLFWKSGAMFGRTELPLYGYNCEGAVPEAFVGRLLACSGVLLVFLWAYQAVVLFSALTFRRGQKLLGMLIVAAMFLLPLIFSTVVDLEKLYYVTPIGALEYVGSVDESTAELVVSLISAGAQLLVFGVLCAGGFHRMATSRPHIQQAQRPAPLA